MKKWLFLVFVLVSFVSFSQRDFTMRSKNKKTVFGKQDLRKLRYFGLQAQIGASFNLVPLKNRVINASTIRYTIDPDTRVGAFADIGLAHFPKKAKISKIISYYDWGLGFKLLGGEEKILEERLTSTGQVFGSTRYFNAYYNGYAYARFDLHKNVHFGKKGKFFLDFSVGANVDYRVASNSDLQFTPDPKYHQNLVAQLHLGLGFGFKLRRGTYLITGVRSPVFGGYEWNNGSPKMNWFSSKYLPALVHLKLINLFKKRAKKGDCNTPSDVKPGS